MIERLIFGAQAALTVAALYLLRRAQWPQRSLWGGYLCLLGLGDLSYWAFNRAGLSSFKAPWPYFALTMLPYMIAKTLGISFLVRSSSPSRQGRRLWDHLPSVLALIVSCRFGLVPMLRKAVEGPLNIALSGMIANTTLSFVTIAVSIRVLLEEEEPRLAFCAFGLLTLALVSWGYNVEFIADPASTFSLPDFVWLMGVAFSAYPVLRWPRAVQPEPAGRELGFLVRYWLMTLVLVPVAILVFLKALDTRSATLVSMTVIGGAGLGLVAGRALLSRVRASSELQELEASARLAGQVAHDIRAPLAALEALSGELTTLPQEKSTLIHGAVERIGEVARTLTEKSEAVVAQTLAPLVEAVTTEKRLLWGARRDVELLTEADSSLRATVQPGEFKRILSNILDNAIEALEESGGTVRVSLSAHGGQVVLSVQDDGRGIPLELLGKLGRRGETHGKAGGSGLGLYHARVTAEFWGGSLDLVSSLGRGTTVNLVLPELAEFEESVLIDDDALVRRTWEVAAKRAGRRLHLFSDPASFYEAAAAISRDAVVYLDSELAEGVKGEDHIERVRVLGFAEIYLATGYTKERFVGLPHLRGVVDKSPPFDSGA